MSDENKTHSEQMAERMRERDRAAAEAEANRAPGERTQAEHNEKTDNRRGRENTVVPEHTRDLPPPTDESPFGANPKPPLKILNIDGAGSGNGNGNGVSWIDFSEPAPMELIQAIYDNSKDGPVTIWSRHLVEADFSALLWNWLMEGDAAWRSRTLAMQLWEPPTEVPPRGNGMVEVSFSPPAAKPATQPRSQATSQQQRPPTPPPPQQPAARNK